MKDDRRFSRRIALSLGAAGLAGLTGFAGCLGGESGVVSEDGDGGAGSGGGSATPLADHPAAMGIDTQPFLGPDPLEATATIIAFEDPSCSRCKAFEQNVLPDLRPDIDDGTLSFVARSYPVVYPWGKPATQALEATYDRDEEAFWGLFDHYYAEQDQFSTDNVLDRTRDWLGSNTDLDAEAIVADAEDKRFNDAVQTDLTAGDEAGANGVTPSLFLFRDGEYRTKARGSVSYDVIAGALGL